MPDENYEECPKPGCILISRKGEQHAGPCLVVEGEEEVSDGHDE